MTSAMYKEFADEYDTAIQSNYYNAKFERPSLLSLLPPLQGINVLDLGCGPGVYATELTAKGANVTAVDSSDEMVELTKKKIGTAFKAYVQDISIGLPQESTASFDIVICPLTIHYLENIDLLFKDVRRVLKPDGLFVFSTHHPIVDFRGSPSGDYFATEQIEEQWNTLGRPVTVSYYRRPISAITSAIANSGLVISNISEGNATEALRESNPDLYQKLSTKPTFIFYVCRPMQTPCSS